MRTPIRPLLLSGMVLAAAVAFSPICSAQPDQGAPTLATSNSSGGTTSAAPGATKRTSAHQNNRVTHTALPRAIAAIRDDGGTCYPTCRIRHQE